MLLWLGAVFAGVVFLTDGTLGKTAALGVVPVAAIATTTVVLLLLFVGAALPTRRLREWLGLSRFDGSTEAATLISAEALAEVLPILLVALAVAALVVIPWPVTGVTSLGLAFQSLAWALPHSWRVGFSSAACSRRRGVSIPA